VTQTGEPAWRRRYRTAATVPLLGLAVASLVRGAPSPDLPAGWYWLYPDSITRGLLAYTIVLVWLWVQIGRRPLTEVHRLLWLAPLVYVGILWLLLLGPALARGRAAELWEENGRAIGQRTLVHLIIGYACVALLQVARGRGGESEEAG
jgi:hypothetical protein